MEWNFMVNPEIKSITTCLLSNLPVVYSTLLTDRIKNAVLNIHLEFN